VGFEWDQPKAEANIRKHRVDFADAVTALDDPCALTVGEEMSWNEERCVTVGWTLPAAASWWCGHCEAKHYA
jgi:uncharacterized DUF497 family protein